MKYVTIPENVVLGKGPEGVDVVQSFLTWLTGGPLNGKQFGTDGDALRLALRIEYRFKDKAPGDVVPLEDKEWELLVEASERPEGGFITGPAKLFIPFMDAVKDAKDEEAPKAE